MDLPLEEDDVRFPIKWTSLSLTHAEYPEGNICSPLNLSIRKQAYYILMFQFPFLVVKIDSTLFVSLLNIL